MHAQAPQVLKLIEDAFPADAPSNLPLLRAGSYRDEEVLAVEAAFRDKTPWTTMSSGFLDDAPDGWASALSFLSDEAASFFLPAYLAADLRGELMRVDPVFYLTDGLDGSYSSMHAERGLSRKQEAEQRWRLLTPGQCAAVAAYLRYRLPGDVMADEIRSAVDLFWAPRAASREQGASPGH